MCQHSFISSNCNYVYIYIYKCKVIPLQARRGPEVGTGIALLFHDRGTRNYVYYCTVINYNTIYILRLDSPKHR